MLIKSKDNSNIKLIQKLLSSKKTRDEQNVFIIEGRKVFEDALFENIDIIKVFISEKFSEKHSSFLCNITKKIPQENVFYITDELSDKIAQTAKTQGIFAIAKKINKNFSIISGGKYLLLENLQDPANIGTIIRTADAVGLDGVILSSDCCDVYNEKVVRATMGSLFRVNFLQNADLSHIISTLKSANIPTFAAVIDSDATDLKKCDFENGAGVIIGNEGNGLCLETISLCDFRLTIKMNGNLNSLNAAMASTIIAWEMSK